MRLLYEKTQGGIFYVTNSIGRNRSKGRQNGVAS